MNAKERCKLIRKLRRAEQRSNEMKLGRKIESTLLNCSEKVAKAMMMPSAKSTEVYSGSVCLPRVYWFKVNKKISKQRSL